jgi:ketosteroid isomerase-like protein
VSAAALEVVREIYDAFARRDGASIFHVWTVRDGRVSRFEAYIETPAMLAALAAR